jgi:gamma-glutamylcyclotransferase (GGCT)/AIG2-like uncharacterized protein YtfP
MFKAQKNIPLAVYGTLRKGYANYSDNLGDATFLGTFKTKEKYRLIESDYPCVLPYNGEGHCIEVDLFMIDESMLDSIDRFEGYPDLYQRTQVQLDNDVTAWMYIRDEIDTQHHLKKYTDKHKS